MHGDGFAWPFKPHLHVLNRMSIYNDVCVVRSRSDVSHRLVLEIHWLSLEAEWVKLNTNGSFKGDSLVLGCGGLTWVVMVNDLEGLQSS